MSQKLFGSATNQVPCPPNQDSSMRVSGISGKLNYRRGASGLKMGNESLGIRGDSFSNGYRDLFKRNNSINLKNTNTTHLN